MHPIDATIMLIAICFPKTRYIIGVLAVVTLVFLIVLKFSPYRTGYFTSWENYFKARASFQ
jgi:hypothetical protein